MYEHIECSLCPQRRGAACQYRGIAESRWYGSLRISNGHAAADTGAPLDSGYVTDLDSPRPSITESDRAIAPWPNGTVQERMAPCANFFRISALGTSARDTSLLARAMGTKALSYIEHLS